MPYFVKKRIALMIRDEQMRKLFQLVIDSDDQFKVVAALEDYEEVGKAMLKVKPDAVVVDLIFSETMNGIEAIRDISKTLPRCHILVFSTERNRDTIFSCFRAGASGYILKKRNSHTGVLNTLKELCDGGAPLSREVSKMVVESFHVEKSALSEREAQVLQLMTLGKSYTEISEELLIAKETSKSHIRNIYKKLKVHDKATAIAKGRKNKIIAQSVSAESVILS